MIILPTILLIMHNFRKKKKKKHGIKNINKLIKPQLAK